MAEVFEGLPVKSVSIDNMLNQRAAVLERLEKAFELLRQGREIARAANIGFPRFKFETLRYIEDCICDTPGAAEASAAKEVDLSAWQYLLSESGLRTFMDKTARDQWNKAIEKGEYPAFTREAVEATFSDMYGARADMFERGVIACFKSLSWDYKTNKPFKFGKRIVMRYIRNKVSGGAGRSLGWVGSYTRAEQLDDLSRVFHVLDGKPEPDHRTGWAQRISRVDTLDDPDAEDDYMRIKCFRNGNGHITFKRLDLVERMNKIIAKHYPGQLAFDPNAG